MEQTLTQNPLVLLFFAGLALFGLWVTGRIIDKAGYNRWWALVILAPLVNLVFIWVFAFAKWPALGGAAAVDGHPAQVRQSPRAK